MPEQIGKKDKERDKKNGPFKKKKNIMDCLMSLTVWWEWGGKCSVMKSNANLKEARRNPFTVLNVLKIRRPRSCIQSRKKINKSQQCNLSLPSCVCLLNVSLDTLIIHSACVNRSLTNPCLPHFSVVIAAFSAICISNTCHLLEITNPCMIRSDGTWLHCFTPWDWNLALALGCAIILFNDRDHTHFMVQIVFSLSIFCITEMRGLTKPCALERVGYSG